MERTLLENHFSNAALCVCFLYLGPQNEKHIVFSGSGHEAKLISYSASNSGKGESKMPKGEKNSTDIIVLLYVQV